MSITAQDIQTVGFEHSLRGYDVEQVDEFLERVAQEVDIMNRQVAELTAKLAAAQKELAAAQETPAAAPEELADANSRAERATEELEKAQSKVADAMIRAEDAEAKLKSALMRAEKAEKELEPLKEQLAEKNKLDGAISEAFISAQRSANALKEEARAEGERIYRESEAKAREFIREALAKKASIYNEIDALQKSSDDFREQYIAMVEDFAIQAKEKFSNMEPPQIPDEIVNDMLPDIESMPGLAADASDDDDDDLPKLTADNIPSVNVPKSNR